MPGYLFSMLDERNMPPKLKFKPFLKIEPNLNHQQYQVKSTSTSEG